MPLHRTTESASAPIGQATAPMRIQLSRKKGWRLPANTAKVDRSTEFGNPYCVGVPINMRMARRWGWNISPEGQRLICKDITEAVARFTHALHWDEAIHDHLREKLGGKNLACWCALDEHCHADALLIVANSKCGEIADFHAALDRDILARTAKILNPDGEASALRGDR